MKCTDCGNDRLFDHHVSGVETREYGDDGRYLLTLREDIESNQIACHECGSEAVDD